MALLLLLVAVVVVFVYQHDPAAPAAGGRGLYPACNFRSMTGLNCPGCGATRATWQLMHGNIGGAFYYNPLYVLLLPVGLIWGGRYFYRQWRGVPVVVAGAVYDGSRRHIYVAAGWLGLILGYWVVRNLPFWPWMR